MILVFGSAGLLGSALVSLYPKDTIAATRKDVDISQPSELHKFIEQIHPDVIINCAGIVKNRNVPASCSYRVNTAAPILMAETCDELGIRLIQVSTDCVFDGEKGGYVETDIPKPADHYGVTKLGGEIIHTPHLTIRSSFIGWPDPNGRGLIAWIISNKGKSISGYTGVLWNGMTSVVLSRYLIEVAYDFKITGLRHIFSEIVSKFDVLNVVNDVYKLGCTILPTDVPIKNMTLRTIYNDIPDINDTCLLYDQVREMEKLFRGII